MFRTALVLAVGFAGVAAAQSPYGYQPAPVSPYGTYGSQGGQGSFGSGSSPYGVPSQGYETNRGTYVQPYMRSAPNSTQTDNYDTRGNVNPYTGAIGTRQPRY